MAIVQQILTEGQILGFKGQVDFYYHRGRVIARAWPTKRTIPPRPKEAAQQSFFGRVNSMIKEIDEPTRQEWRNFVKGRNIAWPDMIRKAALIDNPERELLPPVRIVRKFARKMFGSGGMITWYIEGCKPLTDNLPLTMLINYSEEPIAPIKWQAVKYNVRRRAIMDQVIRPTMGPYMLQSPTYWYGVYNQLACSMFWSSRPKYVQWVLVPSSRPDAMAWQSPIYTEQIEWYGR